MEHQKIIAFSCQGSAAGKDFLEYILVQGNICQNQFVGGTSAERSWHEQFLLSYEFSYGKCSEIAPEIFKPSFCGTKRSHKIPAKFPTRFVCQKSQGGSGSVRLRFGGGTVRAVPVFGSGGSSAKRVCLCFSTVSQAVPVIRFLEDGSGGSGSAFGFGKNGSDGFRFPVPVRFLKLKQNFTDELLQEAGGEEIRMFETQRLLFSEPCPKNL